ncbi:hypothetical protein Tco_0534217 [Tanacetum coccineum]
MEIEFWSKSAKSLKKENNGSFEVDIKIGPAVADITEVGQGKSTECSEDTYAEGLALLILFSPLESLQQSVISDIPKGKMTAISATNQKKNKTSRKLG